MLSWAPIFPVIASVAGFLDSALLPGPLPGSPTLLIAFPMLP